MIAGDPDWRCVIAGDPDWPCPGEGKCHGCLCWCDFCGDVDTVCHSPTCQRHHCKSCKQLFGADDHYEHEIFCSTCALVYVNEDQLAKFELFLKWEMFDKCDEVARDLIANPVPYLGTMARPWWGSRA